MPAQNQVCYMHLGSSALLRSSDEVQTTEKKEIHISCPLRAFVSELDYFSLSRSLRLTPTQGIQEGYVKLYSVNLTIFSMINARLYHQ
jgi:hypothetical protein